MLRRFTCALFLVFAFTAPAIDTAAAATIYDGQWSLTIVTERGDCDRTYNFVVDITNGIVSHPNLVRLNGRVGKGGSVSVSVAAAGKSAAGSGRLNRTSGKGRWTGFSGRDRCSGSWTVERY